MYTRDGEAPMFAEVAEVHNQDGWPFYTIVTSSGREINTDNHHLKHRPKASWTIPLVEWVVRLLTRQALPWLYKM